MGLAPDRSSLYRPWSLYFESWGLPAALPAALLDDLGPDRFSILWHSDEPLPAAYAKLTGRPFDAWALDFAQHQVGRIVKENALTSGGWAGWVFWMALLFAWLAVRMREQPAQ